MKKKEFLELTGISDGALRYYIKVGIVSPSQSQNGYNDFSLSDMSNVLFLQKVQSLGITVSQYAEIINHYSYKDTVDLIAEKYREKEMELKKQRILLSVRSQIIHLLKNAEYNIGLYNISDLFAFRYLNLAKMNRTQIIEMPEEFRQMMKYKALCSLSFAITVSDLENGVLENSTWRLIIPDQAADLYDDPFLNALPSLPQRRMLYTYFRLPVNITEQEWISNMQEIVQMAAKRSLQISDHVEGIVCAGSHHDQILLAGIEILN